MAKSGELESIYRKYGIWNDAQRELSSIALAGRFYGMHDDDTRSSRTIPALASSSSRSPRATWSRGSSRLWPHPVAVGRAYGALVLPVVSSGYGAWPLGRAGKTVRPFLAEGAPRHLC